MPRYAQLVVGPAGSGKSTYISTMMEHSEAVKRQMFAVNLDPACEVFNYNPIGDIRELIHVDDVMEDPELNYGPNGALVYAMEYLTANFEWLTEKLGSAEDDYVLFDTPGQVELISHSDLMRKLVRHLESLNFRVCVVFLIDSQFITDMSKYFSSLIVSLITLINLELPVVSLLTKVDKLSPEERRLLDDILEPDASLLDEDQPCFRNRLQLDQSYRFGGDKFYRLSRKLAQIVDDYSLQKFLPMSVQNEDMIGEVLFAVDNAIQYGEDADVNVRDDFDD